MEDHAFLPSYNLAPPPPLLSVSYTGDTQEDLERETTCWPERGEGGGGGANLNHTTARKPGPLKNIQYSLLLTPEKGYLLLKMLKMFTLLTSVHAVFCKPHTITLQHDKMHAFINVLLYNEAVRSIHNMYFSIIIKMCIKHNSNEI